MSIYKNEVERPQQPSMKELSPRDMGCEILGDAMDIAYGGSGKKGYESDKRKLKEQFKDYGW